MIMYKRLFFIVIAICFIVPSPIQAQLQTEWGVAMGSAASSNVARNLVVDASGNVYTVGYFLNSIDIDPGPGTTTLTSAGGTDIFLIKYNSSGALVWGYGFGSTANDYGYGIALDNSGNVVITGSIRGTVDFDPTAGTLTLNSGSIGNDGIFIAKYSSAGVVGNICHVGAANNDIGYGVAVDASNNIYVTGVFNGTVDFDPAGPTQNLTSATPDVFIAKYTFSLIYVWAKSLTSNGTWDIGYSIDLDASGNVYAAGIYSGTIDLDPGAGTSNFTGVGQRDMYVCKLDNNGNFLTGFSVGGAQDDYCYDIKVGSSEFYITGSFQAFPDFNPGAGTAILPSNGGVDCFVAKYDLSGVYQWATPLGGLGTDVGYGINIDPTGNVLTTGYFSATADFAPGYAVYELVNTTTNQDIFISKISPSGNFIYARSMASINGDYGYAVHEDASGNLYLSGNAQYSIDVDPSNITYTLNSGLVNTAIVVKYNPCTVPATPSVIIGDSTVCEGSTNTYFVPSVPGATSYTWDGSLWTGSSTTNSIDLTSNFAGITISVTANNGCGAAGVLSESSIVLNVPGSTGPIIGNDSICSSDSVEFSVGFAPFADTIVWLFPAGWSSNPYGYAGMNNTFYTNNTGGNIIAYCQNSCGTSMPETLVVTVIERPVIFSNNVTVCEGSSAELEGSSSSGSLYWHSDNTHWDTLATGPNLITAPLFNDTSFNISATYLGCTSLNDYVVNVDVNPMPVITTTLGFNSIVADQAGAIYQWLDCSNSLMAMSGEVNQSYTIVSNGSYAVEINLNGCIDTSSCVTINSFGLTSLIENQLVVFPNPASDYFSLKTSFDINNVQLMDLNGRLLRNYAPSDFYNISTLAAGSYLIKVMIGSETIVKTLIKY